MQKRPGYLVLPVLCVVGVGLSASSVRAQSRAELVSKGERFEIKQVLKAEGTTVVLFIQETSTIEQQFLADLKTQLPKDDKVLLDVVRLKALTAPAAQQYKITATPTSIVYDRFGKELARTSQPEEIRAAVRKGQLMARIHWIDEDDPKAPEVYGAPPEALKHGLPGIVKTMGLRPDAYKMFNLMSQIHFSDGFLKRREHEMIAAYVSSLNQCKF
ncbi:MAG: hypothetical protein JWL77_3040 [Chthonomonadaceae bacterium]|nr:hypothetical protein [Chthonomonadaceae bacterium]